MPFPRRSSVPPRRSRLGSLNAYIQTVATQGPSHSAWSDAYVPRLWARSSIAKEALSNTTKAAGATSTTATPGVRPNSQTARNQSAPAFPIEALSSYGSPLPQHLIPLHSEFSHFCCSTQKRCVNPRIYMRSPMNAGVAYDGSPMSPSPTCSNLFPILNICVKPGHCRESGRSLRPEASES